MTPERLARIKEVANARQFDLTVILENVHDPHNIGAVLRSCDSVGIKEVFVLYTEEGLLTNHLSIGRRTAMGTQKWLDVHLYTDLEACFQHVRRNYQRIYSTHLGADSKSIYDLDLSESVALLFGNEHNGLSEEILEKSDGNFIIPQVGMAQSLNISVACAVSVYEAYRQRHLKDLYQSANRSSIEQKEALVKEYVQRHESGYKGRNFKSKS